MAKPLLKKMYFPYDEKRGIFVQTYYILRKEYVLFQNEPDRVAFKSKIASWIKNLRSPYIKTSGCAPRNLFL